MSITALIHGKISNIKPATTSQSGKSYCRFSVSWQDGKTNATVWASCVVFDELVVAVGELHNGDSIAVKGVISISEWEAANGEKRTGFSVVVNNILTV